LNLVSSIRAAFPSHRNISQFWPLVPEVIVIKCDDAVATMQKTPPCRHFLGDTSFWNPTKQMYKQYVSNMQSFDFFFLIEDIPLCLNSKVKQKCLKVPSKHNDSV
jgi:hypothetical protein